MEGETVTDPQTARPMMCGVPQQPKLTPFQEGLADARRVTAKVVYGDTPAEALANAEATSADQTGPWPEQGPEYPRTDGRVKWNRAPLGAPYEHAEADTQMPLHPMGPEAEAADKPVGNHVPFDGGGMREPVGDRPRFELLWPKGVPFDEQFLTRCAVHMAKGAHKYASRNWEDFSDTEALERCESSAHRHLMQWLTGVDDGEDHAAAVMFNLMAAEHVRTKLLAAERAKYPVMRINVNPDVYVSPPMSDAHAEAVRSWPDRDTTRD